MGLATARSLYVADEGNNRIEVWNTIPTVNNTSFNLTIGEPDLTTGTANYPSGTPTSSSL